MDSGLATKPGGARHRAGSREDLDIVERGCTVLDQAEGGNLSLARLAGILGISPWRLHRLFKRVLGVSPHDYAAARRAGRLRAELREHGRVAEATYGAGYGSSSRVYEKAADLLGMTPASYARGGRGAAIVYGFADTALGRLLVAATGKGVCFVAIGENDEQLVKALEREFPAADSLAHEPRSVEAALSAVLAHLAGHEPHLDLPLDIRATAFQRRVWNELVAIPWGETRSYAEIAARLGLPAAQRAVGRACASNPVALLIPCHRVLRSDGGLGGYRWGVARKKRLLRNETTG